MIRKAAWSVWHFLSCRLSLKQHLTDSSCPCRPGERSD